MVFCFFLPFARVKGRTRTPSLEKWETQGWEPRRVRKVGRPTKVERAQKDGAEEVRARKVKPRRVGANKFLFFCSLSRPIALHFPAWGLQNTFGASWSSCETPGGPRGPDRRRPRLAMKDRTCLPPKILLRHDHDWTRGNEQLGSTVEQQPVGKLVQQSCGEVQHETFSKPTQSKPNPICDRSGKPEDTERVVDEGKTYRSQEIDDKSLQKKLGSSDRTGKPVKLSEDIRVKHAHDGTGEPVKSSASIHIVKEQFVPEEHRDMASSDADNEFNRATDEENIDFNIPGVPNSRVKR